MKSLNLTLSLLLLFAFLGLSAVPNASAQSSPEVVIKAFYNGYIRSTGKGVDPFGKRSTLKKHLTARLIKEQVTAFETSQEADYFLQSQEYDAAWENNFTVSNLVVKGPTATAIVTFPDGYPRVKVTLRKAAGAWKIDGVQNAQPLRDITTDTLTSRPMLTIKHKGATNIFEADFRLALA